MGFGFCSIDSTSLNCLKLSFPLLENEDKGRLPRIVNRTSNERLFSHVQTRVSNNLVNLAFHRQAPKIDGSQIAWMQHANEEKKKCWKQFCEQSRIDLKKIESSLLFIPNKGFTKPSRGKDLR